MVAASRQDNEIVRRNGTVLKIYQKKRGCTCRKCMDNHNTRKRASYSFNKNLYTTLLPILRLQAADIPVLRSLVLHLEGTPLKLCPRAREHKKLLERITIPLESPFREHWRLQPCEREPTFKPATAVFDHTEIQVVWKDKAYKSRKGFGYTMKFLCVITMQGTIMRVIGPFPGRMHDFQTCKLPGFDGNLLHHHFTFERWFADCGYYGVRDSHVLLPHKKPKNQPLPQEHELYNARHSRLRARVEHTFACFKRRFKMFASPIAEKNPLVISGMFKLAALIHGLDNHEQNVKSGKYRRCGNRYWKTHDEHPDYTDVLELDEESGKLQAIPCNCKTFPNINDIEEKNKSSTAKKVAKKKAEKKAKKCACEKTAASKKKDTKKT